MRVNRLQLTHYRNLSPTVLEPGPGVNVIWGKTPRARPICMEALLAVHRLQEFSGSAGQRAYSLWGGRERPDHGFHRPGPGPAARLTIRTRRSAALNGVELSGASQLAGRFCGIVFSPAHLSLIKGGPEERRKFVDAAYCQLRPGYLKSLTEYSRALAQRNTLLKDLRVCRELPGGEELLEVWDQRLAQAGAV